MTDSREIGMRVGAATNQAAGVVGSLVSIGYIADDDQVIAARVASLAGLFLGTMEGLQNSLAGYPQAAPAQPQVRPAAPRVVAQVAAAFPGTTSVTTPQPVNLIAQPATRSPLGYNTQFSGAKTPLKLAEHPELDGWLHAQAAAVGVDSVWDNRGKPNYITAVNSGSAKTPPPFRSATEGIEKSFWPPS